MSMSYYVPPSTDSIVWATTHAPLDPDNWTSNQKKLVQVNNTGTGLQFTLPFPLPVELGAPDDQKTLVYDHATTSFILKAPTLWTIQYDSQKRFWFDFTDEITYTVDGSNYLTSATNKVSEYPAHDVPNDNAYRDPNGQLKTTFGEGTDSMACIKCIKNNNPFVEIPQAIPSADPAGFIYIGVIALDSTQTLDQPIIWSSPAPALEMKLFYHSAGELRYKQNGSSEYAYTVTLTPDTKYIVAVRYDGSNARVYLNGSLVISFAVASTSVPASSIYLGSQDELGGYPSYNSIFYYFDYAFSMNSDYTTLSKLEGWLANKHSMQSSLPLSHSYRYLPPYVE